MWFQFHQISSTLSATKSEDTTHESHFTQMTPENRKFLEDALKSMTLDVIEELNKAMRTLQGGNASEEDQVQSLEVVTNFVADMDTANGEFESLLNHRR
jgi:hsp70-interacting protein